LPPAADKQSDMPFLNRSSVNRRVERLIRAGIGVRETTWTLDSPGDADLTRLLTESIVGWVRLSMGEMRRPYGIDHVALALACRDGSGRVMCSTSLGVLRPISFYGDGPVTEVNAFLGDVARVSGNRPVEMVGALLSLGDIAFELNGRPAAA
jgi:hypothetical protein